MQDHPAANKQTKMFHSAGVFAGFKWFNVVYLLPSLKTEAGFTNWSAGPQTHLN